MYNKLIGIWINHKLIALDGSIIYQISIGMNNLKCNVIRWINHIINENNLI